MAADSRYRFYEFFCGGGMARLGLGRHWRCEFANDIDPAKLAAYADNFGADVLRPGDVSDVAPAELPGAADLAWASFPCQDLSLAGPRGGLKAARSGVFYSFWRLMEALQGEGRAPRLIGLENVPGLLTCSGGADFTALCEALDAGGYRFGAVEIDARWFTPQSRPRLFVLALRKDIPIPSDLALASEPDHLSPFITGAVRRAAARLPDHLKAGWVWWALPVPPRPNAALIDMLDPPRSTPWHAPEETKRLIAMMSTPSLERLKQARKGPGPAAGALYRRMRVENSVKVQRAEVRFDGLAGCLRTPGGGSSRQFVVWVKNGKVRTRPMTAREYARLMGLPEDYILPARDNAALHLAGDGVSVDAVAFLRENLFEPVLDHARAGVLAAE